MKRTLNYHEYVQENRQAFQEAWFRWQQEMGPCRPVRTRPRDPHEIALLDRLAQDNWHGALQRGDLVKLGPRRYRLRVPESET